MPTYNYPTPSPITVSARLAAGSLDVIAEERTETVVTVEPYDGGSREAADEVTVELSGTELRIRSPELNGHRWWNFRHHARVKIEVRVPLDSTVDLKSASARLNCAGRYAAARLDSASGSCHVDHVTGATSVDTASGSVEVGTAGGDLSSKSASGSIRVGSVAGDARTDTASGSIKIEDAGSSLRAGTASGSIRVGVVRRGTVKLDAVSGSISVGVASGTGVWLDVRTLTGSTSSDLATSEQPPAGGQDLTLKARTVSGNIDIHRAPAAAAAA